MDKAEFKQMCQSHGLRMVSDTRAAGMERGFLITVRLAGKKNITVDLPAQKDDQKRYAKDLKRMLRESFGKSATAAWGEGTVTIFLDTVKLPDVYCQGVPPVLDILKNLGFTVPDKCGKCGRSGCDAAVPKGTAYEPVHRSCLEGAVTGAKEKADNNMRGGSYLLGFIGAFLGAVVGVLPSALTIILAQRIMVYLFVLIPICAYFGYKLCKGKMNYAALVATILFSVLGVYLLNFGVQLYYIADYFGIAFGDILSLFPAMIGDPEMWLEVSKDIDFIKCAVFTAIGIALAWGQISRTAKSDIKDAAAVAGSAIPYGEPQPDVFRYDPARFADASDEEKE